ncbi:MAG: response regulator [Nanoarchaeota archaeon]
MESKLHLGSTFQFIIPYIKLDKHNVDDADFLDKHPVLQKNIRILVVEDNLLNQKFVLKVLEKERIEVTLATNGNEAIDLLDESMQKNRDKFNLILMDIQMPVLDGLETTKLIRKRSDIYRTIPIIALTANSMDSQLNEYFENGMNACVKKPIILSELLGTIYKWA